MRFLQAWLTLALLGLGAAQVAGPTQAELNAADSSTNSWLMMNKGYLSQRYVPLSIINTRNVARLRRLCTFDTGDPGPFQATPQVYRGIMYVTKGYHTYAINAANCRLIWGHTYQPDSATVLETSRGAALYQGLLIRGSGNAHLYALNMRTGRLVWDTKVADSALGFFTSSAPIAWNDLVFTGEAGADWGIKARMHAFNARTGKPVWTFDLIPTGQEFGANTWQRAASTTTGGGSTWTSYALDTRTGRLYVSVGNPAPDFASQYRPGANLFTNSLVVLDARSGKLSHYYQQRPNDDKDLDTSPTATLFRMSGVRYVAVANKEGNIYTYNERTQRPVYQVATVRQLNLNTPPTPEGVRICPNYSAGSQWYGTTYFPPLAALILPSTDWCGTVKLGEVRYVQAQLFFGGSMQLDPDNTAIGQVSAFDARNGRRLWRYQVPGTRVVAGVTNTAGNLTMSGDLKGDFFILNARTGRRLFQDNIDGAPIGGGASTYLLGGRQYIAVAVGNSSRAGSGAKPVAGRIVIYGLR